MGPPKLFDENSDEDDINLKTENPYAKNYDRWREKEELHKLEQKYGSKPTGSDVTESDSEEEDNEPPELAEEVEAQFLKTLSLLKTKDPRIYDPNYKFFNEKLEKEKNRGEEFKKVTFDDSDDDDNDSNIFNIEKKAVIDEHTGNKAEDVPLKDYLIGKVDHIDEDIEKDLAPLKSLWSDPKLNDGEAFLRDYILNKRYLDPEVETTDHKIHDDEDLEADEKTVEEQGKFERAYNFRFEEPDEEYLKRYPRTMNFIRPKDDRRSRKRAEIRQRKEEEKTKKMEEIARLKALKLKEIREKIAKIKEVTGNEELAFEEADIEGDFDPAEHDRRMKAIFDEQFYGKADDEKPVFPDIDEELEIENWEKFDQDNKKEDNMQNEDGPHCEDDNFNMDADYDPKAAKQNLLEELKRDQNKRRRNRKRKSKLAEILEQEKPKFAPQEQKTYAEYMEEYYKMDCEDVIEDLPTRFKYREVVPNDYGLTIEEILLADDKELTQWVPLKKIVKHRPENIEMSEVKTYRQKAADERLKKKILPSLFKDLPEEPEIVVPIEETILKKKKKKKKKNKSESGATTIINDNNLRGQESNVGEIRNSDKPKKRKKSANTTEEVTANNGVSDSEIHNSLINNEINTDYKDSSKKKKIYQQTLDKLNDNSEHHTENITKSKNDPQMAETINKKGRTKCEDIVDKEVTNSLNNKPCNEDTNGKNKQQLTIIEEVNQNKLKKKKRNIFKVEEVMVGSNKASSHASTKIILTQKRKANHNISNASRKKDKNKKQWKPQQKNENANSLAMLSDERLKAYGLNPKKYRSFLKYKKF